jgi:cell division protein FtsL
MARAAAAARAAAPAPRRKPVAAAPARKPATRTAAPVRRKPAVAAPRRSGRRAAARRAPLGARLAAIPHSPFVDRLLTGRAWIVLVGGLLAGIVFVNVALLELNAGIARTSEQVSALKRENGRLRLQAARLGSTERIQQAAARIGLVLPAPGQVRYLKARPVRDARRALAQMRSPDSALPVAVAPAIPEPQPVATTVPTAAPVTPAPAVEPAPVAVTPAPAVEPQAAVTPTTPATGPTG